MSLFRNLNSAAIPVLKPTEMKVFLILLNQTLGYGKSTDNLTNKRIAQLVGIRSDHIVPHIDGVIAAGLFDREESKYYDFKYTIGSEFLDDHYGAFFTPALPKIGKASQDLGEAPESWGHTYTYPYPSLPLQPQQQAKPESDVVAKDACGGDFELPKGINEKDHAVCRKVLSKLSEEARFGTLAVFGSMQAAGVIKKPVGLLVTLAEKAQQGLLTLPESTNARPAPLHPSHKPAGQAEVVDDQLERASRLQWLKTQAKLQSKPLTEVADFYNMQDLLGDNANEMAHMASTGLSGDCDMGLQGGQGECGEHGRSNDSKRNPYDDRNLNDKSATGLNPTKNHPAAQPNA